MARAATELAISQPAVSRAIADMEASLGVSLLDRGPQGVDPTPYGRALINRGIAIFDELAQGVKEVKSIADPASGEVSVGCNRLLAASFAAAVVDRMSRRYPRVIFHLLTGDVEALHHELSERNFDLLIARKLGPITDERLDFEFLFDDSCVVAAGAQSPWARRRRIVLAELVNEPWVLLPPGSALASMAMEAFSTSGLEFPRTTVITDSPQVRMNLLATGRFLTVFPASALRLPTQRPELKVLPVELPMARVPNGIVTLKKRTLSPVARHFIDTARQVAKPLARKI
jgi:DNA-binding transcriptional LysR family regulator